MRNLIIFLSLTLIVIGVKQADAQSTFSDWRVPPPISPNNVAWKASRSTPSKEGLEFVAIKLPQLLAVLAPIPPVEPLSIPADLTIQTQLESESSSSLVEVQLQENAKPQQIAHSCCCDCCCRLALAHKSTRFRPKRKILSSSHIRRHKIAIHKSLKPRISRNANVKPKTIRHKHRSVKRYLVRYIRYCPCRVDTCGRLVQLQENAKPQQIVHSCCCCCCHPAVAHKQVRFRSKRKILSSSHIRKHKRSRPEILKPKKNRNANIKTETIQHKHKSVKRYLVRYIRYCPCSIDTSSSVNDHPKTNGGKLRE